MAVVLCRPVRPQHQQHMPVPHPGMAGPRAAMTGPRAAMTGPRAAMTGPRATHFRRQHNSPPRHPHFRAPFHNGVGSRPRHLTSNSYRVQGQPNVRPVYRGSSPVGGASELEFASFSSFMGRGVAYHDCKTCSDIPYHDFLSPFSIHWLPHFMQFGEGGVVSACPEFSYVGL